MTGAYGSSMESQSSLAGVSRNEAQSATSYKEAIGQTDAAPGMHRAAQRDLVAGFHERQPGATVSYPEHSGRRGAGSVGHRDRYKSARTTCRASLAATRNLTRITQSDTARQWPELTSQYVADRCKDKGAELRFVQPGKPNRNAFIERFNRSYRTEVLEGWLFTSLDEVREITHQWLQSYNEE